jgi:molecular chaperone IbpA|tara:strand:- start:2823 stop:3224 length:402 start_codon:yes stop_codon:yes gene_type:complete
MTQFINDFDLVFKNFFDQQSRFQPVVGNKMNYPVDIFLQDELLHFEIAAVGLKQGDIEILTEGETLRVKYEKKDSEYNNEYIHRGITRRSFDFAWKISSDLNISKAGATMKDGLLRITIPYAVDRAPKRIAIK